MKNSLSLPSLVKELRDAHGISQGTVYTCQKRYYIVLRRYVAKSNVNKVACASQHVALDERGVGKLGNMPNKKPSWATMSDWRGPSWVLEAGGEWSRLDGFLPLSLPLSPLVSLHMCSMGRKPNEGSRIDPQRHHASELPGFGK